MFHKLSVKEKFKIWFFTLFYHSQFSFDYCVDVFIEPLVWFVDHFTKFLGKFFVALVCFLIAIVVFVAHVLGIPFWWRRNRFVCTFLTAFGYWILTNIIFNYYHAVFVDPGVPSDAKRVGRAGVTVCKTCISPKPPRTHHCSVCKRCYLKMDHHCPWVNNCIGHFNHRYFYLTTMYIFVGCVFIMLFGAELAFRQIFMSEDVLSFPSRTHVLGPVQIDASAYDSGYEQDVEGLPKASAFVLHDLFGIPRNRDQFDSGFAKTDLLFGIYVTRLAIKAMIYLTGLLCIGASICLGGLAYWHGNLISRGETSIEYLANKNERKKHGNKYVNLYDLGRKKNWILFLGLDQKDKSFCRHILLPSRHNPTGDGYEWDHILQYTIRKTSFSNILPKL